MPRCAFYKHSAQLRFETADDETRQVETKDFYLSLTEVNASSKVRELSTQKIGTLTKIQGQVV